VSEMPERVVVLLDTEREHGRWRGMLAVMQVDDARIGPLQREEEEGSCHLSDYIRADLHAAEIAKKDEEIARLKAELAACHNGKRQLKARVGDAFEEGRKNAG
jgi:hypothetical protein